MPVLFNLDRIIQIFYFKKWESYRFFVTNHTKIRIFSGMWSRSRTIYLKSELEPESDLKICLESESDKISPTPIKPPISNNKIVIVCDKVLENCFCQDLLLVFNDN